MGVNARWYPPVGTRLDHVRDAIAVLCGAKVVMEKHGPDSPLSAQYMDAEGNLHFLSRLTKVTPTTCPEMVSLSWDLPLSGQQGLYWHFESEWGRPLTAPRSRGFYIALLIGLCNFIGGDLQFSDCDDEFELSVPQPWFLEPDGKDITVERSNEKYHALQRALYELPALTLEDLRVGESSAAYDGDFEEMKGLFTKKGGLLTTPVTTRKKASGAGRGMLTK